MRILMVCLGNICRSPLAEGILRSKAAGKNLKIEVDSAGTSGWHTGEKPDRRAIAVAGKYNIDITDLRARSFHREDFRHFDRIYVMDENNLEDVLAQTASPEHREKVSLILDILSPASGLSVPDPYHGGDAGFEHVFKLLDQACTKIIEQLD